MLSWIWIIGLLVLVLGSWLLNFISLPGNWIMVGLVGVYAWLGPASGRIDLGWPMVVTGLGLATVGEIIEFAASAFGARKAGGSNRSAWFSIGGSLIGSVVGVFMGIPIPLVGPVIGAVLFAGLGALFGAVLGERTTGRPWRETLPVGEAAFWGRLVGMAGKVGCGIGILVAILVAMFG